MPNNSVDDTGLDAAYARMAQDEAREAEALEWREGTLGVPKYVHASAALVLNGAQAHAIAEADALTAYRDLTRFRIQIAREEDGWHVDYELTDRGRYGGGPHYVIEDITGKIISKRYEQ